MNDENRNNEEVVITKTVKRRTGKLFMIFGITAAVFIIATYAWFIGTSQVTLNNIELEVKASDGIQISLNGKDFASSIDITKEGILGTEPDEGSGETTTPGTSSVANYPNNNSWFGGIENGGLTPISTVGVMDTEGSVLKLFNKTSITALYGGYKLRADQVMNYTIPDDTPEEERDSASKEIIERDGYVVFDLYIKNSSSSAEYSTEYAPENDEGIYMTTDSTAYAIESGSSVGDGEVSEDTTSPGLENSLRIAFMQIGRVVKSADQETIVGITCASDAEKGITGLCNEGFREPLIEGTVEEGGVETPIEGEEVVVDLGRGVTWNIWEPNDAKHTSESVTHFGNVCKIRRGADSYGVDPDDEDSTANCTPIADGTATKTFAINQQIIASDNINVYDGLNEYEDLADKLTDFDYYTDTDNNLTERDEVFFLASNSITKVRVYIYLEGQDVDNFDLDNGGRKMVVSFGFNKTKFLVEEGPEPEPEP